ncbi:MAG: hypothetical protein UY62_C0091G0005 [Parcubacteria group bacterium GW2011_GWF2_50_9]|nr:MAG: hypothetical protein UY62_C0091G0005 [Parcubacteria group bacterium GW2011_GWF2_50_9]
MKLMMVRLAAGLCFVASACPLAWGQTTQPNNQPLGKGSPTTQRDEYKGLTIEQSLKRSGIKGSRRIELHPIRQISGISTGLVMAYGHIIPPPYNVKYQGDKLLINGVQVSPSLVWEREQRGPAKRTPDEDRRAQRLKEVRGRILDIYTKGIDKKPIREIQQEITSLVLKSSDVFTSPRWKNDLTLEMVIMGGSIPVNYSITLGIPAKLPTPEVQEKLDRERQAEEIGRVQNALKRGLVFIYYSEGGSGVEYSDFRPAVNEIMSASGLTREQRFEQIKERVFPDFDYDLVLDVIENYNPTEWRTE